MQPLFVQRYVVKQDVPIISISSSQRPVFKGKVTKDEMVNGILKDVTVILKGKRSQLSLLQIGQNKYIVPKYVVLEKLNNAVGGTEAGSTQPIKTPKKTPFIVKLLPITGLGAGLYFAHVNRTMGTNKNKAIAYIGYGALGLFLLSIPYFLYSYGKTKKDFDNTTNGIADEQKSKDLNEEAYKILMDMGKKAGQNVKLDKDEFEGQFNELNIKEKEAFVYIGQETLKLPMKDKMKYLAGIAEISNKATEKFGADVIKSLSEKTTLPS